jgi:defect in organelle trafficking protein DotD
MMKNGFFLITAGVLMVCAGCSQTAMRPTDDRTMDVVESKLVSAAKSVSKSLYDLAAIESANTPESALPKPPNAEALGMAAHASIHWTGPIEPLIEKIAHAANYTLQVLGHQPAMPTMISVKAKDSSLATILRDARFQAQKSTEIVVYPSSKIIELRYLAS